MEVIGLLIGLAMLLGIIFGWIALFKVLPLKRQVDELQIQVQRMTEQLDGTPPPQTAAREIQKPANQTAASPAPTSSDTQADNWLDQPTITRYSSSIEHPALTHSLNSLVSQIKDQWMVWLGGLSVALAGIFLVKYSIEQGFLGPAARITIAILTGLVLHIAGEWIRRHSAGHFNAVAALAGGASITLYAGCLAALHLYQLWPPMLVFGLLTMVSLATMALSLLHGPVLAIIGILGAFAVPALVGGDAPNLTVVLIYSLIISAAALLLMRYIYRDWLWWGTIAGAGFWWFMSLVSDPAADSWLGLYLTLLAYGVLTIRSGQFSLRNSIQIQLPSESKTSLTGHPSLDSLVPYFYCPKPYHSTLFALLLIVAAQCLSIIAAPEWSRALWLWLPLNALILWASRADSSLRVVPWISFVGHAVATLVSLEDYGDLSQLQFNLGIVLNQQLAIFLAVMALLYCLMSLWNSHTVQQPELGQKGLTTSLGWLSPLLLLALAYITLDDLAGNTLWAMIALITGLIYMALASYEISRQRVGINTVWLIVAAHLGYSLAAVIAFSEATLTLALAFQVLSLVWLSKRYELKQVDVLIKAVLMIIVARLTLNPWLATYETGMHWSLWSYGGCFLVVAIASRLSSSEHRIGRWLEAVSLHLLVLFINTEIRYWLYDGNIFTDQYNFTEAALNTNVWAALALVYHYRMQLSQHAKVIYRIATNILVVLAVGNYLWLLTGLNPLWQADTFSPRPILNWLLIAYGLPVIFWWLISRYIQENYQRLFKPLAGLALLVFVSLEIRHLWQGGLDVDQTASNGELYTYSVVWLLMAVMAMVTGTLRKNTQFYQAGVALLALVIAKIFLIDLSGLTGLLRVLSFMGLGLCLLGLAYLHQWLNQKQSSDLAGDNP